MAFINTSPRSKKFIKDFGIYTVGAIGTRIITFLMVSLYCRHCSCVRALSGFCSTTMTRNSSSL